MNRWFTIYGVVALMAAATCQSDDGPSMGLVRNGGFNVRGALPPPYFSQESVEKLRADGWKCPDIAEWPQWWSAYGRDGTAEFPHTGGVKSDGFARLSGKEAFFCGYDENPWDQRNRIYTIWARGKGRLSMRVQSYGQTADGNAEYLEGTNAAAGTNVIVNSDQWIRYRHVLVKTSRLVSVHPWPGVQDGALDLDEIDIVPSSPALDLIVAEEERLYGTGALIENLRYVAADAAFRVRVIAYREAVNAWRAKAPTLDPKTIQALDKNLATLDPYVLTQGLTTVAAENYNDMLVLTRVCRTLAGLENSAIPPVTAAAAPMTAADAPGLYPGRRDPRPNAVTITKVRSNKVRYIENEGATTTATVVNKKAATVNGTIKARMSVDLDTVRDLAGGAFSVGPGEEKTWTFSYNVGPETYGRAIEVEFADGNDQTLDTWREYYAVATEFFRVHQHCYQLETKYWPADVFIFYFNQSHWFAAEPTDFGIESHDAEVYKCGQDGKRIHVPDRKNRIAYFKKAGIATSFYVTGAFCGQMGYEQARRHPEFVLYAENGQWAEDPVYGGYPNPMEIASPLEVGPKRKEMKIKPYLDRIYTPWQHGMGNMASEDAVVWNLECMKKYADEWGFDGIYWDGCLGVWKGYGYDGLPNVPSGKYEDYVALGARNHRLWNQILKRDNPLFGTWMNWGMEGATGEWARKSGITIWLGSGVDDQDPLDDNVRAAAEGRNVMMLDEHGRFQGDDYRKLVRDRMRSRDHYVQKYGVSHIIGYATPAVNINEPGPTKWGWPTWNHILSVLTATQSHLASDFVPSYRPTLQFQTRYSRFIWAPDIKVVPDEEGLVSVQAPEELWWKRLVYRRDTDAGHDLIVHLIRKPATETVDYAWADEPDPLAGATVSVDLGDATLQTAMACRPYHFEEEQQTVEQTLTPDARTGRITVTVPPFRYYTMLVFRVSSNG